MQNSIYIGADSNRFIQTWFNALNVSSDGYFYNIGYTDPGVAGADSALLIKHDDSLNMIFYKVYERPGGAVRSFPLFDVLETDSGFMCLGIYHYDPDGLTNIVLLKTDSSGNELDRKVIGVPQYWDYARTFTEIDGSYWITGTRGTFISTDSNAIFSKAYIIQTNENLDILDSWIDPANGSYFITSVIESSDSTITYCGAYTTGKEYIGGGNYFFLLQGYIRTILKSDYSTVWDIKIGNPNNWTHFNEIKQLPDKSFIAIGELIDTIYPEGSDSAIWADVGWLVKVSNMGQLIWERKYWGTLEGSETNYLSDFEVLPNGDIIACGESRSNVPGDPVPQQGWLIRVDSFGCLVPGCQLVGIEEPEQETKIEFIKIFPNPTDDWLYIYFNAPQSFDTEEFSFTITNMNGEIIEQQPAVQNFTTYFLETRNYASGVYFVYLMRNGELVQTEKFVKQ